MTSRGSDQSRAGMVSHVRSFQGPRSRVKLSSAFAATVPSPGSTASPETYEARNSVPKTCGGEIRISPGPPFKM